MYGNSLEAVGATYGLMWFTPAFLCAVAMSNVGPEPYGIYMVDDGFQAFLERIVEVEGLQVKYNSFVAGLKHVDRGDLQDKSATAVEEERVELEIWRGSATVAERAICDFVVWTGAASQLMRAYPAANAQEKALLSSREVGGGDRNDYLASSLVSLRNPLGRTSLVYSMYLAGLTQPTLTGQVMLDYTADKTVRWFS